MNKTGQIGHRVNVFGDLSVIIIKGLRISTASNTITFRVTCSSSTRECNPRISRSSYLKPGSWD